MNFQRGELVRTLRGHDEGTLYYVLRTEEDFLYLVDGKHRRVEAPKKKRCKHVASEGIWTPGDRPHAKRRAGTGQ